MMSPFKISLAAGFLILFSVSIAEAQVDSVKKINTINTLPTQQEIDAKMARYNNDGWQDPKESAGTRATGPEQDCENGIIVCQDQYVQGTSYTGVGTKNEIPGSTCLGSSKEKNSVWYIVSPQNNGTFGFEIETAKDYDFAMWDITTDGCSTVGNSSPGPIRCNFSATYGNTGLDGTAPLAGSQSYGAGGAPIMNGLNVSAGNTYAILINNWSADATGYTLNFNGSALVPDVTPPTITSVAASCTDNTIVITMSEEVLCSTIATGEYKITNTRTATDYFLTDPEIVSIAGDGCTTGSFTRTIIITHDGSLTSDPYEVVITGTTLEDKCGNNIAAPASMAFNYLNSVSVAGTSSFCDAGDVVSLTVTGYPVAPAAPSISWSPGIAATTATVTAAPSGTTTYTVNVTYGGCTKSATHTATIVDNVITSINPVDPTICSGTTTLSATTTINGVACVGCTYVWSTTETTSSINQGAGTYMVTVTTSGGCPGDNVPQSTISLASAGGGAVCDILYVSPAGGGDGLTKANPTDLQSALTAALCSNTIIKMQTGTYNFTDKLTVNSYVTIEGGYNSTFTSKSSNLTSGTGTTLVRSNAADSDNSSACTMFYVVGGAENFRMQDLRIEMPTNIAAGTGVSTYGIYLGASCVGYNIVRCYIDAGYGAAD